MVTLYHYDPCMAGKSFRIFFPNPDKPVIPKPKQCLRFYKILFRLFFVQRKAAAGNAVGIAADGSAQRCRTVKIALSRFVAEPNIVVFVRHENRDNLAAIIDELHGHAIGIWQGKEIDLFTLMFDLKAFTFDLYSIFLHRVLAGC